MEFSNRFVKALRAAGHVNIGATRVAAEFNARYPEHALSVHGVRKWLIGEAVPQQGKLLALAGWLNVTPGWLLFDSDAADVQQVGGNWINCTVIRSDCFATCSASVPLKEKW